MGSRGIEMPDGCDCCGHDAEDCGMPESGWVTDSELIPGAVYCHACAHLLWIAREPVYCTWCDVLMADETRADELGWSYFADEYGDLHACCPGCLADAFGITGRVSVRHRHEA